MPVSVALYGNYRAAMSKNVNFRFLFSLLALSLPSEMMAFMFSNKRMAVSFCLFLTVVFFMFGCNEDKSACTECIHVIDVPLLEDDITGYPRLSELFSSIDTVYLENAGPESLVESVDEVKFTGDTIIVRSANNLFFFDSQGRFLKRFFGQDNDSSNCVIERFDLLPQRNELYILDGHNNKVIVYGMDGGFHRQIDVDDYVTDFAVLPDGGFLLANPLKYPDPAYRRGLWRTDANGRFVRQLVEFDPEFAHVSINNPYINHISPGVTGFMGVEDNDRFYTFSDDSVKVTCRMTTDIVIPDYLKHSDKVFTDSQKEYTKCGYQETGRFLYFVATNYGANVVMVLVDKTDWTTYRMYVYTEDFNYNASNVEQFPYVISCYNGTLIGFFDSGMVLHEERFRRMFPSITADSNPVLVFYRD